ncbi:MAG: FHA domain-containing protein [Bacteriovoracia bacterium]
MSDPVKLLVTVGDKNFFHQLSEGHIKLGRSLNCDFSINSDALSREHCLFEISDGKFYITDLNSKNGITVNGVQIEPGTPTPVSEESKIILANKHYLIINGFAVKSKSDIINNTVATESDTKSFQFELEGPEGVPLPQKPIAKIKVHRNPRVHEIQDPVKKNENLKMILGFIIILGILLYHALGE